MISRFQRWLALPGREQVGLLGLMALLPLISLCLALLGYSRTRRLLDRLSPKGAFARVADERDVARAERLALLIGIAGRHGVMAATCLRQSLLLRALLRRRGLDAELRLGVRKFEGDFDAHAWVDLAGHALAQGELQHRPLDRPSLHIAEC